MDYKDLKDFDEKSLQEELSKYKREYFNLRFQKSLGELNDTSRMKVVRKNIARILTRKSEK